MTEEKHEKPQAGQSAFSPDATRQQIRKLQLQETLVKASPNVVFRNKNSRKVKRTDTK